MIRFDRLVRHSGRNVSRTASQSSRDSLVRISSFFLSLIVAIALVARPVTGQERPSVQLPEDQGDYPTGTVFIQNLDAIWTAAGQVIENGSIYIEDGIIRQIGTGLSAPEGATVLDGVGLTAMPGIVDEHSHIALRATNESTSPIVPEVRVMDALDPEDFGIYRALSGGVTTARIMHGSANPVGGQSAVIKTRWGMDRAHQLLIPGAPRFVKFALGENVTRKGRGESPRRFPFSRQGVEAIYVEAFTAAQEYRDEWTAFRADPASLTVPPRRDLRLEALVDIMEGRIRVHAHSYRSDEILMLMRVAERFGFRIDVFTHVLEGYQVATEMAEHGAAGSTFSDWWQYKLEAFDAIPHNAAIMHRQGVLTAINSDIPWLQSFMHLEIPKPVKYGGVDPEEALQMLTLNPARMMRIDDKVGSLEVGKQGDVVLLSASPFSSLARVEKTLVDGIVYFDLQDEAGTRDQPFNALGDLPAAPRVTELPGGLGVTDRTLPEGDMAMAGMTRSRDIALVGATVHPVSRPAIEDGVVVVRGGRITAVGTRAQVPVPDDVEVIDVSGRHVFPGMIDPLTTLGLLEFGQVEQAQDVREVGRFNPHIRAVSAIEPHGPAIGVARANGITAAGVTMSSGIVDGTAGLIQLRGDTWERVTLEDMAALHVDFPAPSDAPGSRLQRDRFDHFHGENGLMAGFGDVLDHWVEEAAADLQEADEEIPELTGEPMEKLVEFFERARLYTARPSVADGATEPFEANVWGGDKVVLDAMVPVMRGERPVIFDANTEWQIRTLFVFLDSFPEIRAIVAGGSEAYMVADELAERDLPVLLTSAYSPTSNRSESITAGYRNAAMLEAAGVRFAFSTGSNSDVRNLPYHAAHSVAFGLSHDAAHRAVTLNAAEILGFDGRMGSLDAGKRADLIVTDGDILEMLTEVERMWIGGVEVDPRDNKHHELYQEFRDRR